MIWSKVLTPELVWWNGSETIIVQTGFVLGNENIDVYTETFKAASTFYDWFTKIYYT